MASEAFTRTLSKHLHRLMEENQLKLEYVAASADVGVETVRRVKNGDVRKIWDRTGRKLARFVQRESEGKIDLEGSLGETGWRTDGDIFRELVEHNMDGIYLIQDSRIVYSNTKVEAMTGYTSEELSSQIYTRFLDSESEKLEHHRKMRHRQGKPFPDRYEVAVITKDGTRLRAETRIAHLSLDGKKTALGTIRELAD